jgi:hypothetical protein
MYFIICILLLLFIILIFFQKILIVEYFENNKNVFLIGDSILQNNLYANPCIEDYLSNNIDENNLFFLAEDNTTISSCISQIKSINDEYNNKNSFMFVSVGGNDILNKIVYVDNPTTSILDNIMTDYSSLIESFLLKMNKSNVILLNIYYPTNSYFHKYYKYIDKWNQFVKEFSEKNNCVLLDLTEFMNSPDDFSFRIEPSAIGGEKISNHIISIIGK